MIKRTFVLLVALMLGACSHSGLVRGDIQTNTMLTSNNYRVVMTGVKGDDVGFRVFGIGASAQYSNAMEKIRVQAQLEERPRALINVTVDDNWWSIGLVGGSTVRITADVVEFTGSAGGN